MRPGGRPASSLIVSGCLLAVLSGGGAGACRHPPGGEPLGLPDAYMVFAPARDEAGRPRTSKSGLPLLDDVALDDARAVPYHKMFAVGFAGEMLRSDYLLKQLVRDGAWQGKRFSAGA